ncbi:MAG TPA: glycerol-3-phosphate 1-O-acyltransferase PlsY [bacterium]|nr:glycerol-3-phosphate 1-O-acyltransferase PlsY [bacterium]
MTDVLKEIAILVTAYLLGSIPFGYLLVKWVKGVDVRTQGSGNIGMTNVWRVAGAKWGILTLVLDIAKGALAVAIARYFDPNDSQTLVLTGVVALLGNIFSVFLNFKGGKGIGISVGVFFSLLPMESTAGLIVFLIALAIGRMISVGSLLGVTTMAVFTLYEYLQHGLDYWYLGLALFAAVMIWWTHRQNIQRILKGTENKIGKKKA